ncbi:MAG: alpha/beta hydrolase family protein [Massilia sp.]
MLNSLLRRLALAAFVLAAAAMSSAQAQQVRPPIEHFFADAQFSAAQLSPNAKFLAVRVAMPGKRESLIVFNLESGGANAAAGFAEDDINHFQWVNDERLVFDTTDRKVGQAHTWHAPGLYAVNRDGTLFEQLVKRDDDGGMFNAGASKIVRTTLPWNHYLVRQVGMQNSEFVYVSAPTFDGDDVRFVDLKRLSTLTGRSTIVPRPDGAQFWLLDHKGEPRIAVSVIKDTQTVNYRDPASGEWRALGSFPVYGNSAGAFFPLAFGPDGTLYVETQAGKDKKAVHTYDLASGKISAEPVISTGDYDFDGELITSKDKVLGMRLTTDAESTMWFDAKMQALQKEVDGMMPSTVNLLTVSARAETPWVMVETYSDVAPRTWLLFNTETKAWRKIGNAKPKIEPAQMGHQTALRYKARDGLDIPGWLTLPANSTGKNLPMVVLVHGGPFVRGGQWGWNPEAQFLASRGYAVLEPEFRGSKGFGEKHYRAGWKQWGLGMQNDLADGAKWAIAKGIADPKRICIAGASYGGYAALMGTLNDPDLFKCGIDWLGVTDIGLMYDTKWRFDSDLSEHWKTYGMPELVGDRVKDAAQLQATSPLAQAARFKQPLLLAYGGADRRVPAVHGEKFYKAVKASNPNVEWVMYPDEGHGWRLEKTRADFWTRVEKFLDKHIGQP